MKTEYIIKGKTKSTAGRYVADSETMGLTASWTTDIAKAERMDAVKAKQKVASLCSLIPNGAELVEVSTPA